MDLHPQKKKQMEKHTIIKCSPNPGAKCCCLHAFGSAIDDYGGKVIKSLLAFESQTRDSMANGAVNVIGFQGGSYISADTVMELFMDCVVYPETLYRGFLKRLIGRNFGVDCIHAFPDELDSNFSHLESFLDVSRYQVRLQTEHVHSKQFTAIGELLNGTGSFLQAQLGDWLANPDNCTDVLGDRKRPTRFFRVEALMNEVSAARQHYSSCLVRFKAQALGVTDRQRDKKPRVDIFRLH